MQKRQPEVRQYLFMGEQLETLDRGRVYDGTGAGPSEDLPPDPTQHGTHFHGPCVCGRAFFDERCAEASHD